MSMSTYKNYFTCFLWRIHGMKIVLRLVQRSCDWQNETNEEPEATALDIFSDLRRGQTTTFHNDYRRLALLNHGQCVETSSLRSTSIGKQQLDRKGSNMTPETLQTNLATSDKEECECCGKNHWIYRCEISKNLSIKEKF